MDSFTCTVLGQLYSKANSRKFAMVRGRMISIKGAGALKFEADATKQLKLLFRGRSPLEGELAIEATVYYPSQRQDLDASLLFDVLQKAGVIVNDRQLREQHLFHHVDKLNPRIELTLRPRWDKGVIYSA